MSETNQGSGRALSVQPLKALATPSTAADIETILDKIDRLDGAWPAGLPIPVPLADCEKAVQAFSDVQPLSPRKAAEAARRLLKGGWPWLEGTDQDLTAYIANLTTVFSTFSHEAAAAALNPVTGLLGEADRPPSIAAVRKWLQAFDDKRRSAARMAEWIIKEHQRRKEASAWEAMIELQRKEFAKKIGEMNILSVIKVRS